MSDFAGFDISSADHIRIVSFTVGGGGHAEVEDVVLEITYNDGRGIVEVEMPNIQMSAPALHRLIEVLNRRLGDT